LGLGIDAQGRAYLFDGETGKHKQTFDIPEPMRGDLFASSLAGGDGRVFISARGVPPRVYAFDANTGEHLHTMRQPIQHGNFGASVAYGNGSVLVSSPGFSIPFGPQGIGRADLFDAATGQLQQPLPNPEPKAADALGTSLAVFGNRAVVGAIDDDLPGDERPDGDNPGRVWVFDRLTGETVFTLENPNPQKLPPHFFPDLFGYTVAANDDIIVVGAREEGFGNVNGSGAAYVFDSQSGALLHTLFSPHLEERSSFGTSLALTPSGQVLIGASGASVNGMPAEGRVYLFDGLSGNLLLDIPNPEPDRISGFGFTVAATDQRLFVGVPSGEAVFVFEAIPEPSTLVLTGSLLFTVFTIWHVRSRVRIARPTDSRPRGGMARGSP
jgi:outer membrane protein assembly factor BamB